MAFDSYQQFIETLERAGELIRISQPLATELEITELADREMKKPGGGKALLIEKPTVNGVVSPFPVAINTMGSHKRMAMTLGAKSVDEAAAELGALMKAKPPTSFRETMKLLGQAMDLRHAKPIVLMATGKGETTPLTVGFSMSSALPPPGFFISRSASSVISSSVATGCEMRFNSPAASRCRTNSPKESKAMRGG